MDNFLSILSTEEHEEPQVRDTALPPVQESETLSKEPRGTPFKTLCCQMQHFWLYILEPCHLSPSTKLIHLPTMFRISAS